MGLGDNNTAANPGEKNADRSKELHTFFRTLNFLELRSPHTVVIFRSLHLLFDDNNRDDDDDDHEDYTMDGHGWFWWATTTPGIPSPVESVNLQWGDWRQK